MCGRDWSSDVCSSDLEGQRYGEIEWESGGEWWKERDSVKERRVGGGGREIDSMREEEKRGERNL